MAVSVLGRIAARGRVPVFVATGGGAREAPAELRTAPAIHVARSPRHATVLLVAGSAPSWLGEAVRRTHDLLPHPRATVWWRPPDGARDLIPGAETVDGDPGAAAIAVREAHAAVVTGRRTSEDDLHTGEPPSAGGRHERDGHGGGHAHGSGHAHGGGEGMEDGPPGGRPMAEMGEDPDGLMLDALPLRLGPFLPGFPPGLALDLTLQGDVIREVTVVDPPFDQPPPGEPGPFERARSEPVAVAELERARAVHHLHRVADLLVTAGLDALAVRALRLAADPRPGTFRRLRRLLERCGSLSGSMRGVGRIPADLLERSGGPAARASGSPADARLDDPAYTGLGFEAIVRREGDARARWRLWIEEAERSLDLAGRTEGRMHDPGDPLETPTGPIGAPNLTDLLPDLLPGMEVGDAVATVASLGIDLEPLRVPAGAA